MNWRAHSGTALNFLDEQAAIFGGELMPLLAANEVKIVRLSELDASVIAGLGGRFQREIFPVLTPQAVDRARRFPHVSNQSLNLIVVLRTRIPGFAMPESRFRLFCNGWFRSSRSRRNEATRPLRIRSFGWKTSLPQISGQLFPR